MILDIKESQRMLFFIISDTYVKVCLCLFLCCCFHVFVMIIGTKFLMLVNRKVLHVCFACVCVVFCVKSKNKINPSSSRKLVIC